MEQDQISLRALLEEDLVRALADRAGRNGRTIREELRLIMPGDQAVDRDRLLRRLSEKSGSVRRWNIFEAFGQAPEKDAR